MAKVKAYELRKKDRAELLKDVKSLKQELLEIRTSAAAATSASKLSQIRTIRKSIARVLTVHNEKRRAEAKEMYLGKKYIPKDLRKKATRAMRRRLPSEQAAKKTVKAQKKASNFPLRKFALLEGMDME